MTEVRATPRSFWRTNNIKSPIWVLTQVIKIRALSAFPTLVLIVLHVMLSLVPLNTITCPREPLHLTYFLHLTLYFLHTSLLCLLLSPSTNIPFTIQSTLTKPQTTNYKPRISPSQPLTQLNHAAIKHTLSLSPYNFMVPNGPRLNRVYFPNFLQGR